MRQTKLERLKGYGKGGHLLEFHTIVVGVVNVEVNAHKIAYALFEVEFDTRAAEDIVLPCLPVCPDGNNIPAFYPDLDLVHFRQHMHLSRPRFFPAEESRGEKMNSYRSTHNDGKEQKTIVHRMPFPPFCFIAPYQFTGLFLEMPEYSPKVPGSDSLLEPLSSAAAAFMTSLFHDEPCRGETCQTCRALGSPSSAASGDLLYG
jgi:hypothetical protein